MSDKNIDKSKMKCMAYITDGGYMYQYIYYDESTKQFFAEGYHYGSVDDAEEHYDGIEEISFERALRKVYPKLEKLQKFRDIERVDFEKTLKQVVQNYKNLDVPKEAVKRIINSNLTSDDCAYYYECENGEVFKYSQATWSFYRYNFEKNCWVSDDNAVFTILNQDFTEYYGYKWREKCNESGELKTSSQQIEIIEPKTQTKIKDNDINLQKDVKELSSPQNVEITENKIDQREKKKTTQKPWLYLVLLFVSAGCMPVCAMQDMWFLLLMSMGVFIYSLCKFVACANTRSR